MSLVSEKNGTILIVVLCVFVLLGLFFVSPISQDSEYHNFSDTRVYLSIPNMFNVLSNVPFVIVGVFGLVVIGRADEKTLKIVWTNKLAYVFLFIGSLFVGIGSGYYHLFPNNETLVWDRIPMTVAFMALYSVIIGEFVSEKLGRLCLLPLIFLGISSVFYWWFTEGNGEGDLRYYAIIQFFPIITIPIMLVFFKSKFNCVWGYWLLLCTYIVAKVFEIFDAQIYYYLNFISGHSIKHVLPAIGLYFLTKIYARRGLA